jgi:FkbM family methyltransferase
MYQHDLIYDVGMFNGDDTAYYLHKGYRVVSIEANPGWVAKGQERFASALQAGRLTIVNVAIGPEEGIAELLVPEHENDATLDKAIAAHWGQIPVQTVKVRTARFRDIQAEYGVPFYLKIDIEHFDHYCLEDLDPFDLPRYVSFEAHYIQDLLTMRSKGFEAFKIIRQFVHKQLHYEVTDVKESIKRRLAGRPGLVKALGFPGLLRYKLGQLVHKQNAAPPSALSDWVFPGMSSGPFAEETDGPWRSFEEAAMTWLAYERGLMGPNAPGTRWFDIHCFSPGPGHDAAGGSGTD